LRICCTFTKWLIAWGSEDDGGKISNKTQSQLQDVKMIFSTNHAFAALLEKGMGDMNIMEEVNFLKRFKTNYTM
jgi:hypothetical protein